MILEIHDTEEGNSLAGRVKNIDYDYQAEQWVQDIVQDERKQQIGPFPIARFVLQDDAGDRAVWERNTENKFVLVVATGRFLGEWKVGVEF